MKTLLRLDASFRGDASCTRALTSHVEERWRAAHPDGRIIRRCLADNPPPHLDAPTFASFREPTEGAARLSDTLAAELLQADHVLIGSPLYNFTLASPLKAWFDHIVRAGLTFDVRAGQYQGLLHDRQATVITASGGEDGNDFQSPYLRAMLGFIGIHAVDMIALTGTALGPAHRDAALARARAAVDALFDASGDLRWEGPFSAEDRRQISALREAQAAAIVQGDPEAYAALCSEDVQLLIPQRRLVRGRADFLALERAVFAGARFESFIKFPERVERSGDLAIETGRQRVAMREAAASGGIFASDQKYLHVFRRTPDGWRFAALMSNPAEEAA